MSSLSISSGSSIGVWTGSNNSYVGTILGIRQPPEHKLTLKHVYLRVTDLFIGKSYTMDDEDMHKLYVHLFGDYYDAEVLTMDRLMLFLKKFEIMCPDIKTEIILRIC